MSVAEYWRILLIITIIAFMLQTIGPLYDNLSSRPRRTARPHFVSTTSKKEEVAEVKGDPAAYCAMCGYVFESDDKFCVECGLAREELK